MATANGRLGWRRAGGWVAGFALASALFAGLAGFASWAHAEDKPAKAQEKPGLVVDKEKRTVRIACKIAPRKLDNLNEIYPIEVVASWGHPQGKKAHETVVTFTVKPSEVHAALESLGLKPGKPAKGADAAAEGPQLKIFLEIPGPGGAPKKLPIEKCMVDRKTGKTLPPLNWHFTGSVMVQPDPAKPAVYGADQSGTLVGVFPVTDETVIQSSLTMKDESVIKMETNAAVLPAIGTETTLILEAK